jgi:hypothetical protein
VKSAKIHPLELVALASLIACCFLSIGAGLSFYWPDGHSSAFATEHYVIPLLAALGLAAWSRTRGVASLRSAGSIWWGCLRPTMAFTIVIFLHFNLKLWAQLVNPRRWDEAFLRSDAALEPLARAITWLHEPWLVLTEIWPLAYHDIFVLMFMSSLALHSVQKEQHLILTQLVTCIALVLVIGGFSYALAPAWGPFVYGDGSNSSATAIQAHMSEFQGRFVASGVRIIRAATSSWPWRRCHRCTRPMPMCSGCTPGGIFAGWEFCTFQFIFSSSPKPSWRSGTT